MTYTWPTQIVVGHINLTILSFLLALCFQWREWGWGNEHLAVAGITVHKWEHITIKFHFYSHQQLHEWCSFTSVAT